MSSTILSPADVARRDQFVEQFLGYVSGTFNIFTIYLGERLGLYRALVEGGPSTAAELAAKTGTQERYLREWLEQQSVAGILEVVDERQDAVSRCYRVPAAHVEVLTDPSSLNFLTPLTQLLAGAVRPLPDLVEAFQKGGGVPYGAFGRDLRDGQAGINRPAFMHQLAAEWLPTMPDVHARLQSELPARIADVGCGYGWSSIGMAIGYPNARVDGFDLDEPSIECAIDNAMQYNLGDRVTFQVRDINDPTLAGQYDLVTAFECVHDMSNPVGALRTMRQLAGENGTVLVVDERVGEYFSTKDHDVDWMMYGWSVLHCLPVGMAEEPSAETGTVMRPDTLRRYAAEAGFRSVEVLPIENFFFRFYRLTP